MMLKLNKCVICLVLLFISISNSVADSAADFVLQDLKGQEHQLDQYKGKWLIINYWATWCPPCLEEIPDLVNLYDSRKDNDLMVIGVVFDYASLKEVTTYVDDMLMSYPIVLGDEQTINQIGKADALPTTYIYNPKGEIVKVKRGVMSRQYLEAIMAE